MPLSFKLLQRVKISISLAVIFFFIAGIMDSIHFIIFPKLHIQLLEKVLGILFFLSIYVFFGAILGLIKNFFTNLYFYIKKEDLSANKFFSGEISFLGAFFVFLICMYYVHTSLISKSILDLISVIATFALFILSLVVFVILNKVVLKSLSRLENFNVLSFFQKSGALIFLLAIISFIPSFYYFYTFPLCPYGIAAPEKGSFQNADNYNVILITIDTLRADFLGCYGLEKISTPNIDNLSKSGVQFSNTIAQSSLTTPSHSSILTGTYVQTHGSKDNCEYMYDSSFTLAEALKNSGYMTAAFISAFPLQSNCCSTDKGFYVYNDNFSRFETFKKLKITRVLDKLDLIKVNLIEQKAEFANSKVLYWLKKNYQKKFFLWIHYYDPHTRYNPPGHYESMYYPDYRGEVDGNHHDLKYWEKMRQEDTLKMISLYKGEISYVDEQIGILFSELTKLGLMNKMLIVLTSDHGEGLAEHNQYFVHQTLYDHDLRIPLILYNKNSFPEGSVIDEQVQSVDIMPTILDILNIPIPESVEGSSLLNLINNIKTGWEEVAYSERRQYYSVRSPSWKLIQSENDESELYNLEKDQAELTNLFNTKHIVSAELSKMLEEWKEKEKHIDGAKKQKVLTDEEIKKLRSLGYIN
jgi:arylsulfatase A-like enzyme